MAKAPRSYDAGKGALRLLPPAVHARQGPRGAPNVRAIWWTSGRNKGFEAMDGKREGGGFPSTGCTRGGAHSKPCHAQVKKAGQTGARSGISAFHSRHGANRSRSQRAKETDMIMKKSKRREHVLQFATTAFGRAGALKWMATEVKSLGGATPDSMLDTDSGYQRVIASLEKIEYEVPCWYL